MLQIWLKTIRKYDAILPKCVSIEFEMDRNQPFTWQYFYKAKSILNNRILLIWRI